MHLSGENGSDGSFCTLIKAWPLWNALGFGVELTLQVRRDWTDWPPSKRRPDQSDAANSKSKRRCRSFPRHRRLGGGGGLDPKFRRQSAASIPPDGGSFVAGVDVSPLRHRSHGLVHCANQSSFTEISLILAAV